MGKFIGIDEILQGGTPNRPTHSTPKEGKKGEALARTSLEYPLEEGRGGELEGGALPGSDSCRGCEHTLHF